MISRNLFSKLLKEDLKRRIWTIALATLVFFLFLPVSCAIMLGNYGRDGVSRDDIIDAITTLLNAQSTMLIFITLAGAVICGLSSFFYLHSRKKVDLYHSIPLRREALFAVNYLNGFLIYFITYAINLFLCFVILLINGFMSLSILGIALSAFAVNLLFYCLVYTLTVIAVMLTGNFIISCFGTGVFLLYGPMIVMLKEMYFHDFFSTYYDEDIWYTNFQFLSPLGSYVDVIKHVETVLNKEALLKMLTVSVVTLLFIAFALFLYKKRPSEAAGKAMAFPITKSIIKFLLVIPITLGGGIIFREISYKGSDGWFLFGLIFSLFLSYAIIEIIYNFDIRCAFLHKRHILISAITVLIIAGIFHFDIFKYDSYIPKEDKIESMSAAISGLDENLTYYWSDPDYGSSTDYQLRYMKLTNFATAYDLAEQGIENKDTEFSENTFNFSVKYNLKNGNKVYRSYTLKASGNYDMLKDIFENQEFKEAHYPIYRLSAEDIESVTCYNTIDSKTFSLNNQEKQQLLEIYKEELNHITLDELKESTSLATISLQFVISRASAEYYVYPSFTNTIEYLKEHGFTINSQVDVDSIQEIQIINNERLNENTDKVNYSTKDLSADITITDKAQIKEIYAGLISNESYWNNRTIIDVDTNLDVLVTFKQDEYGNQAQNNYYFKNGQIPDYVKTALSVNE